MTEVINPATEEVVATVAALSAEEADLAIGRAAAAFEAAVTDWERVRGFERL